MFVQTGFSPDLSQFSFSNSLRNFRGEIVGRVHTLRRLLLSYPIDEVSRFVSLYGSDAWEQDPLVIEAVKFRMGNNYVAGRSKENRKLLTLLPGVRVSFEEIYQDHLNAGDKTGAINEALLWGLPEYAMPLSADTIRRIPDAPLFQI